MNTPTLHWSCLRFAELGVWRLYQALALRCRVFILEQGPYLDPDGADLHAAHLMGHPGPGDSAPLLAYLRIVDPGVKYAEPSLGRVIVAPEVRGQGLAHALTREGLLHCAMAWPGQGVRISAQAHLQALYAAHGFVEVGEPYLEDNIPHLEMLHHPQAVPARIAAQGCDRPTQEGP
jgi:ElaA protein